MSFKKIIDGKSFRNSINYWILFTFQLAKPQPEKGILSGIQQLLGRR
jgi:hypothetical protein